MKKGGYEHLFSGAVMPILADKVNLIRKVVFVKITQAGHNVGPSSTYHLFMISYSIHL